MEEDHSTVIILGTEGEALGTRGSWLGSEGLRVGVPHRPLYWSKEFFSELTDYCKVPKVSTPRKY